MMIKIKTLFAGSDQGMKKRRTGKDAEPSKKSTKSKKSSKCKTPSTTSKSGKSVSADKSVYETEHIVQMDVEEPNLDDVANDVDEPQAYAIPKIPKLPWADLVGLAFNLLKGTYKSCVELEYNMEECYRVLTDQLDWANLEGHKSLVDMSKPLPLQDKEGRHTIPVEFFFNNDLEYLKAGNKERSYSSSITKTPAARYTLEGIEDIIPTLWSSFIIAYDKDAAIRISH
ncbi:hypothetical protein Tco_1449921 [Tanacetum coccineum]